MQSDAIISHTGKPVLTYARTVCGIAGVGEFGEKFGVWPKWFVAEK